MTLIDRVVGVHACGHTTKAHVGNVFVTPPSLMMPVAPAGASVGKVPLLVKAVYCAAVAVYSALLLPPAPYMVVW